MQMFLCGFHIPSPRQVIEMVISRTGYRAYLAQRKAPFRARARTTCILTQLPPFTDLNCSFLTTATF